MARNDPSGISENDRHGRNVEIDKGARANHRLFSDGDLANDDRMCADPDPIADCGCACARTATLGADGDAVRDIDIPTKHRIRADNNAAKMTEIESRADACRG